MKISENLLQFIWKSKILLQKKLTLTNGESIIIHQPGILNSNQGPDFLMAKILINDIEWVGNIEIHLKSSDWNRHQHSQDQNYNNVILHVVYENDIPLERDIPCLELKGYIDVNLLKQYQILMNSQTNIPCQNFISDVPRIIIQSQWDNMMAARLQSKVERLKIELSLNNFDWEALFYYKLCYYLVTPVNSDSMNELTKRVSYNLLQKQKESLESIEAILFGTAGFLEDQSDAYALELQARFLHLKAKHQIQEMESVNWKFLRMRPSHFPTMRIAQIATLYFNNNQILNLILECNTVAQFYSLMQHNASQYWERHYSFGNPTKKSNKSHIGKNTLDILIINVVAPFFYTYSEINHNNQIKSKADQWLYQIKAESNKYTKIWDKLGIHAVHSGESQAMIEQYKSLCSLHKCVDCKIGAKILTQNLLNN